MSIGTVLTTVGTFLSGPIMTGAANVATFANLGLGIATKIDTKDIKSSCSGIRSDLRVLDNDVMALSCDVSDFRQESRWNVALGGGTPIQITHGGDPQYAPLQMQSSTQQQPPAVQQPVQTASQPTPPAQAPVQTVTVNPGSEALTKGEFNAALTNFANGLGNMFNGFVGELKDVMNPTTPTTPTTAPETPPTAPKGDASKTGK